MRWYIEGDDTPTIITARGHIQSAHGNADAPTLPGICVLYELGMAMGFVQEAFDTHTLIESLPGFINNAPCIAVRGMEGVCFTHGGYGGPSAVDTLETLCALGVHTVVVVGMCGGFGQSLRVGDVVIPYRIRSEEGTSWHYVKDAEYAYPDAALHSRGWRILARPMTYAPTRRLPPMQYTGRHLPRRISGGHRAAWAWIWKRLPC